jgi:hypothetical protein
LIRRVPDEGDYRLGVVVPTSAVKAASRVSGRIRNALNITIFEVTDTEEVRVVT